MVRRLDVYLPDELDKKFREVVRKVYGNRRGALSIAVEQAIRDWIKKVEREEK